MKSRLSLALIGTAFVAGIVLSLWGIKGMHWSEVRAFGDSGLKFYIPFLGVCAFFTYKGAGWIQRSPIMTGVFSAFALALLAGDIGPFLLTIWFGLASALLGRAVLSFFRAEHEKHDWSLSFLIGAGLYGTAAGLLAHFPVNYPALYGVALAAPFLFARGARRELTGSLYAWMTARALKASIKWLDAMIAVVALVHFCVSMMPEIGHDALSMHLFIAAHLDSRHQWDFNAANYVWAVMPTLGDWIFGVGYMLAGETAARMINVGFILVLGWLVYRLVIWAGGSSRGAKWASLIFLATPLAFTESSSLFVESVWASFVVAGSFEILKSLWAVKDGKIDLRAAAILLGCAMAAKAVTLPLLPILLLLLALRFKDLLKTENLPRLGAATGLLLLFGSIPYVTAYCLTGNPVFPFFNKVFQSPYYPAVNFEAPAVFGKGLHWDMLYQITFNSGNFLESRAGAAGFQWLLLLLPAAAGLLACRHRKGLTLLLLGFLYIAITFHSTAYLRYVFPSFALLTAVIGIAFSMWQTDDSFLSKGSAMVAGAVVFLNLLFLNAGARYADFPLPSLRGDDARQAYLMNHLPTRNAVAAINDLNLGQTPVAVFSPPLTAGLKADALYPNWYNFQFQAQVNAAETENAMADLLSNKGVDFVLLDESWGTPEKRALIEKITDRLADFGPVSIRALNRAYRFQHESVKSPSFEKTADWIFPGGETGKAPDGILVSVDKPAYQVVSVNPGQRYLNTVKSRCEKQASQGRMQVNWLDSKSRFISTDIQVFDCSDSTAEHSMEITAPTTAVSAVVYASGHTSTPLVIEEDSLR